MSEKSDQKLSEDKSDSNCSETQTQNNSSDDNDDHNYEYFEDFAGLTFPSILKTNCSHPTELFYTLSPLSLNQISCESTPITTNRRQPIGGENLLHQTSLPLNSSSDDSNRQQVIRRPQICEPVTDRPPLIGRTNSSESSRSTLVSNRRSDDSIDAKDISSTDRDALANKVRHLLGKTKRLSVGDDVESLGLIQVIEDNLDDSSRDGTIDSERSEPDGKARPYLQTQTKPIVHYSSSESDDNQEEEEKEEEVKSMTSSTSNASLQSSQKSNRRFDSSIRNRSYSASGGTGLKNTTVDISSILRRRLQTKESFPTESCETQTNRSFLAEQSLNKQNTTRVKRPIDVSKAIQTSDSLLNIESNDKKDVKEMSCQTNNSFGISSFLKELLKSQLKPRKVGVGTQTIRSFLTEQALKQKNKEMRRQTNESKDESNKISETMALKTKAIQTSYTSSVNSESDSTIINERTHSSVNLKNKRITTETRNKNNRNISFGKEKEPISWFIQIDKKSKNKNISRISRTLTQSSGIKNSGNEQMYLTSSPVPLQEAFNRHCIDMRINSQIRVNRIHTITDLRKQTADERLLEMAKHMIRQQESAKVIRAKVIQPVFKSTIKRFFTHEEMRAQTEKIYNNLPEVKAMRETIKQKEREKNQRLLAQIYKYKLKDNALKGRLTWKITQSCLN